MFSIPFYAWRLPLMRPAAHIVPCRALRCDAFLLRRGCFIAPCRSSTSLQHSVLPLRLYCTAGARLVGNRAVFAQWFSRGYTTRQSSYKQRNGLSWPRRQLSQQFKNVAQHNKQLRLKNQRAQNTRSPAVQKRGPRVLKSQKRSQKNIKRRSLAPQVKHRAGRQTSSRVTKLSRSTKALKNRKSSLAYQTARNIRKGIRKAVPAVKNALWIRARRLERRYIKAGLLNKPSTSKKSLTKWYKKVSSDVRLKKELERWGAKTDRAISDYLVCVSTQLAIWNRRLTKMHKKRGQTRLTSVRAYVKKNMERLGLTSVAGLDATTLRGYAARLREQGNKKKLEDSAQKLWSKLAKMNKLNADEMQLCQTPSALVEWYRTRRESALVAKARRLAKREFNKGKLNFSPDLASENLLVTWYKTQLQKR